MVLLAKLGAAEAMRQRNLFSRRNTPELRVSFPPEEGVGNAGCPRTRSLACRKKHAS
jgi:hypothetical protein